MNLRIRNVSTTIVTLLIFFFSMAAKSNSQEIARISEVRNLITDMEIMAEIADFNTKDASIHLMNLIGDGYSYNVNCRSGIFFSIKSEYCLLGLISFYKSLKLGLIRPNTEEFGLSEILIDDVGEWMNANWRYEEMEVRIPFDGTIYEMAEFLEYQFLNSERMALIRRHELINASVDSIKREFNIDIAIADRGYSTKNILHFVTAIEIGLTHIENSTSGTSSIKNIEEILMDRRSYVIENDNLSRSRKVAISWRISPDKLEKIIQSLK